MPTESYEELIKIHLNFNDLIGQSQPEHGLFDYQRHGILYEFKCCNLIIKNGYAKFARQKWKSGSWNIRHTQLEEQINFCLLNDRTARYIIAIVENEKIYSITSIDIFNEMLQEIYTNGKDRRINCKMTITSDTS